MLLQTRWSVTGSRRREIASAIGIANAGTPLGGALAGPVAGWIAHAYGWRASFVVLALIGFVWTALWVTIAVERPDAHPGLSEAERAEIGSDLGTWRGSTGSYR